MTSTSSLQPEAVDEFQLQSSPADPQPVRVCMIDDCTWWAGYSLQQCVEQAIAEKWIDQHAVIDGRECPEADMQRLQFVCDPDVDDDVRISFAAELQRRIDAGETFPQLFASTEY